MIRPLCGLILHPSILDFRLSSSWDDLSTLWTCLVEVHFGLQIVIILGWSVHFVKLFCIRLFRTSNRHPLRMIRPLYALVLYLSILDFILSSSWDDPSTLWTCFISVHFGLQIVILLGWSVHFVDLFCIRPFWTSNRHPLRMIRPLCGLVLYPSILDFKLPSSWDDPSILWTCFISVHLGLHTFILLGWSVHIVDIL